MAEFETYYLIDGEKLTNLKEVERRVLAGDIAVEVSAEKQQEASERHQQLRDWQAKQAEIFAAEAHRQSPEGRREAALQEAARNPGGIVSCGTFGIPELDAYGPRGNRYR